MGLLPLLLRSKQCSLLLVFLLYFVAMAVSQQPWRQGLYLSIGPRLSHLSSIHLAEISEKICSILQSKSQALHSHPPSIHGRHDKVCPCGNSLLTAVQMVSVALTNPFLRMIASQGHQWKTSRHFFLKLANCPKSPALNIIHFVLIRQT